MGGHVFNLFWLCEKCNPREAMIVVVLPTMVMKIMNNWIIIAITAKPCQVRQTSDVHKHPKFPKWYLNFWMGPFFHSLRIFGSPALMSSLTPLWYQHCLTHPICKGWQPTKMKKPQHCSGIFYRALTIHCDQSPQQRPICQDRLEYSIWEFQMLLLLWRLERKIQASHKGMCPQIKA